VRHVQQQLGVSERRACRALRQPRSSQRYEAKKAPEEAALVKRMRALAKKKRRYGFRRIHALLVREGWRVNRKRVQRLWRAEGLKVVRRPRKRRRQGGSENGCVRHRAEYRNHVWSYDFTMDQTADGKRLKLMPVLDEFTRECHTTRGGAEYHRTGRDRHLELPLPRAWGAGVHPQRQRTGVHREEGQGVAGGFRGEDALH
jgi:putative transposase